MPVPPTSPFNVKRGRIGRKATVPLDRLLAWGKQQLVSPGSANREPVWLLEWATGHDSLLLAPRDVGIRAAEKYRSAVAQRRAGVPLQHVLGTMDFRGLTLKAGPGVFSVRPETELLVDIALQLANEGVGTPDEGASRSDSHPLAVADLCAGSGAIGLALAAERPNTRVASVELSRTASSYLNKNVTQTELAAGSEVEVVVEDAISALGGREGTFDLVLTNPPYVGAADAPRQVEATHDPKVALYGGGEDGLVTPRGIVGRAFKLLKPGGHLVMEHSETQGAALRSHAQNVGFISAATKQDLTGRGRFLIAEKPVDETPTDAAKAVSDGGLVVLPTDTVYGIGADPFSSAAVERLLEVKGREEDRPPPILGSDVSSLLDLVADGTPFKEAARTLAERFWPGPLTIVVPTSADLGWDTKQVGGTVALRVPAQSAALELLKLTGPLAVTSANLSGLPPARNIGEARSYFANKVAAYVNAGQLPAAEVSTIVKLTVDSHGVPQLAVLREGPIKESELVAALKGRPHSFTTEND